MPKPKPSRDTSINTYRAKRDFGATPEPAPPDTPAPSAKPIFVVQKHDATRLHYDFRLEHGGVLWSWAVPKGPSLDPHDKRLAVRTEDHPIPYADFQGSIPEGHYGAGTVETFDRGTWEPLLADHDPAADLARGELKIRLLGQRLKGGFVLIRLKPRPKEKGENWLLIKEHDAAETPGRTVTEMEAKPLSKVRRKAAQRLAANSLAPSLSRKRETGSVRPKLPPLPLAGEGRGEGQAASLPLTQAPQLATLAETAPVGGDWISEIKFDGYRILAFKDDSGVRLLTRNGHDWTPRLRGVADGIAKLPGTFLLDGELVALRADGVSDFAALQSALKTGRQDALAYFAFDLLHMDGADLREQPLRDRKAALLRKIPPGGKIRYSDHVDGHAADMRERACGMGLEGVIAKRADAPYRAGRSADWLKLKCVNREEFAVLGYTLPQGSRTGLGALHVGYRVPSGAWQYAGGVGTGFSDADLSELHAKLTPLRDAMAANLRVAGEPLPAGIVWVRPELVIETKLAGWSGAGRVRHGVFLGLREDKAADAVVRDLADPEAVRWTPRTGARVVRASAPKALTPTLSRRRETEQSENPLSPLGEKVGGERVGVRGPVGTMPKETPRLTHPDRELWPGITKGMLADYWRAVAAVALPGIANRPLALVRCPGGIAAETFFQKHTTKGFPAEISGGTADGAPYVAIADADGLQACAQIAAIELHTWGSALPDAAHADRVIFDLDPGEGVPWEAVIAAAKDVRARLDAVGLTGFCRTTGGKGLHVVAPLAPGADWDSVRAWCRNFAEAMAKEAPAAYVARLPKSERHGKILVDWLRNGLGSTAVASFSPRARAGAPVAVPVTWREVTAKLDAAAFTIHTVPARLKRLRADPWSGFEAAALPLPGER